MVYSAWCIGRGYGRGNGRGNGRGWINLGCLCYLLCMHMAIRVFTGG